MPDTPNGAVAADARKVVVAQGVLSALLAALGFGMGRLEFLRPSGDSAPMPGVVLMAALALGAVRLGGGSVARAWRRWPAVGRWELAAAALAPAPLVALAAAAAWGRAGGGLPWW